MNFEILQQNIQNTHTATQQSAAKAVNIYLTIRNWLIGYYIVEFEQNGEDRAQYGKFLLQKLAENLNQKSLSYRNLKLFRQFHQEYPQIGQSVTAFLENNKSLKAIDSIGEPGSFARNPHIASIFHDTNLAETKGTGIKSMKKLLLKSQMLPPTFESSHAANSFTLRLLLHHLINETDHSWLMKFDEFQLNDEQKTALIFLREVGALDNLAYRQSTGVNLFQSSTDLRKMVTCNLLQQKGNSKKNTYYVPGKIFLESLELHQRERLSGESDLLSGNFHGLFGESDSLLVESDSLLVEFDSLLLEFPEALQQKIRGLGSRSKPEIMEEVILEICNIKAFNLDELSKILKRRPHHIREKFLNVLMKKEKIGYSIPEVINHPKQAYKTINPSENIK
ncbi:MAG: hypothetical protein J0I53_10700 [Chryseobacterium sp.]|nr:hypothetical protein [Chryseobacterium sp.]